MAVRRAYSVLCVVSAWLVSLCRFVYFDAVCYLIIPVSHLIFSDYGELLMLQLYSMDSCLLETDCYCIYCKYGVALRG